MFKVAHNLTDISSFIWDISSITYRRNDDMSFELPEITITVPFAAEPDDVVTLSFKNDSAQQITFIVQKSEYSYSDMSHTWTCVHILRRLDRYRVREIDVSWSGINPSYSQYNTANPTSSAFWERSYWQVLFLIQTLIRKATGLAVNQIDVSPTSGESGYYNRWLDPMFGWQNSPINYESLAVSSQAVRRLGSTSHLTWVSQEYEEYSELITALELLNLLCATLGITIDIFRQDYRVSPITTPAEPDDLAQIGRHDRQLELHRFYVVNGKRLIVGGIDYQFGTFDSLNLLVPFKYGTSDAEYELEQYEVTKEDTDVYERRELLMSLPTHFALYRLSVSDYQSHLLPFQDAENNTMWWHQWIEMLFASWTSVTESRTFTVPLTDLSVSGRSIEVSITNMTKEYEVLR